MLPNDPEMCGQSVSRESQIQLRLEKIISAMVSAGGGTRKKTKPPKTQNQTHTTPQMNKKEQKNPLKPQNKATSSCSRETEAILAIIFFSYEIGVGPLQWTRYSDFSRQMFNRKHDI